MQNKMNIITFWFWFRFSFRPVARLPALGGKHRDLPFLPRHVQPIFWPLLDRGSRRQKGCAASPGAVRNHQESKGGHHRAAPKQRRLHQHHGSSHGASGVQSDQTSDGGPSQHFHLCKTGRYLRMQAGASKDWRRLWRLWLEQHGATVLGRQRR